MDATVAVSESGHKRRITKLETAAKPLAKSVANGDQRAMQLVAHLIEADDPRPRRRSPSASARATPSSCPRSSAASDVFFVFGFAKSERANISKDELAAFRKLPDILLTLGLSARGPPSRRANSR